MNSNDTKITPNDAEKEAITRCEKRLARGNERLDETLARIRRRHDDADIAGLKVTPAEFESLYEQQAEDQALVERLEAERDAAVAAPAIRATREALGLSLMNRAQTLDAQISEWAERGATLHSEADALADLIVKEFRDESKPGWTLLIGPFTGSNIVRRLRFFARETGTRGEITSFTAKVKAFQSITERRAS
jgi:hypothetical protein